MLELLPSAHCALKVHTSTNVFLHSHGEMNVTETHKGDAHFPILKHMPEYPKAMPAFRIPQARSPISIIWVYLGTI